MLFKSTLFKGYFLILLSTMCGAYYPALRDLREPLFVPEPEPTENHGLAYRIFGLFANFLFSVQDFFWFVPYSFEKVYGYVADNIMAFLYEDKFDYITKLFGHKVVVKEAWRAKRSCAGESLLVVTITVISGLALLCIIAKIVYNYEVSRKNALNAHTNVE